jgi:hypothetical protein
MFNGSAVRSILGRRSLEPMGGGGRRGRRKAIVIVGGGVRTDDEDRPHRDDAMKTFLTSSEDSLTRDEDARHRDEDGPDLR